MEMKWEDPPGGERARHRPWMREFVEELKKHPGRWAAAITPSGKEGHCHEVQWRLRRFGCETKSERASDRPLRYRIWAQWPG